MQPREVRSGRGYKEHDKFVSKTIREWAKGAGVQVSDKGVVPKAVRTAWIEAHQGQNNPVLWHNLIKDRVAGTWQRTVEVLCYRCAKVHNHGGVVGKRPAPEHNHRVSHCTGEYAGQKGGYYIEDQLSVDDNEKAMAEANDQLNKQ